MKNKQQNGGSILYWIRKAGASLFFLGFIPLAPGTLGSAVTVGAMWYLNEKYNLDLPEGDDYATLAGMIVYYHGSIPSNTEMIRIGNIVIKVLRASMTRLELVNLRIE
jgi:hypothetical protein